MSNLGPGEITLALKIAYLRGSWDAISVIIVSLEEVYGEVPLSELAHIQRISESMEAQDGEQNPAIVAYWLKPAEA